MMLDWYGTSWATVVSAHHLQIVLKLCAVLIDSALCLPDFKGIHMYSVYMAYIDKRTVPMSHVKLFSQILILMMITAFRGGFKAKGGGIFAEAGTRPLFWQRLWVPR